MGLHRCIWSFCQILAAYKPNPAHEARDVQVRSVVLGAIFGPVFSIIIHKLNLTTGVIPSLGMAIALVNFFTVNIWNKVLSKMRIGTLPFTPQVFSLARAVSWHGPCKTAHACCSTLFPFKTADNACVVDRTQTLLIKLYN